VGAAGGDRSAKDVRFIAELIDTLKASYRIDPTRIYADGLSNGGGMAFLLSCTLSDRIAAVGLVASAQFLPWSACKDQKAVPMIAFHGTDDRFTPYHGGTSWVARDHVFPSIPCLRRPGRAGTGAREARSNPGSRLTSPASSTRLRGGRGRCALHDPWRRPHLARRGPMPEWFAGPTSRGVDATRQSWAFFRAHPLAR